MGEPRLAGVMGWPVGHSKSPLLHGAWLRRYGVNGVYAPLAVRPERFEAAMRALPDLGFVGANVTIPHKEAAVVLADELSPRARAIGAVNTLIVTQAGRIRGDNTDGFGFIENLRANAPGWSAERGPALVLGAGGAARGVVWALKAAGAPEIRLANRTGARADALAREFGAPLTTIPWSARADSARDASLIVNTTSLGMGDGVSPVDLSNADADALVTDIVYAPLETPLLAAARARGLERVDGLGMLLHQARPGFEAWFGVAPEVDDELRRIVLGAG